MFNVGFQDKNKYIRTIDLIILSKKNGFYSDILGVAEKIPKKTDLTVKLGLVKFFILNCPNVKKHIKNNNPENLDYLNAFKEYMSEKAFHQGNWFEAQEDLAKELSDHCSIYCHLLPQ